MRRRRVGLLVAVVMTFVLVATVCDVADPGPTDTLRSDFTRPAAPAMGSPNREISYTTPATPQQVLDLYFPPGSGTNRPVIVYVHGGGFGGNKIAERSDAIQSFATADTKAHEGYVVASVEYRRSTTMWPDPPTVTLKDMVKDVRSAIQFLKTHARDYGIDPNRVIVAGESAGGYLAEMAAIAGPDWEPEGVTTKVQGFVDIVGPYDVESFVRENYTSPTLFAWAYTWLSRCTQATPTSPIDVSDDCWSRGVTEQVPSIHDASPKTQLENHVNGRYLVPGGYAVCGSADTTSPCQYIQPITGNGKIPVLLDVVDGYDHETDFGLNLTALAAFVDNATGAAAP